ncbi:hypothetical protein AB0M91_17550 [Micromonospora rifamycinica]|uniref:hypothetical protein n=1 Tax=Micromonospora rifamycinica TaxID=291594 RepID=UPI0033CEDBF8
MSALVRMRLAGFLRTGRAIAPLLAALLVLGILYGGGQARPAEAYGVCAVVLFPVLAWQTKILLDVEPDVQRRMAQVLVGPARDRAAGLLAAVVAGLGTILVALAFPWLVGGLVVPGPGDLSLPAALGLGLWAHLLALLPATAVGALASRALTRSAGYGVAVLAVGVVGTLVLGLRGSVAPWLAPPVLATARALAGPLPVDTALFLSGAAVGWTGLALAGYAWRRRSQP